MADATGKARASASDDVDERSRLLAVGKRYYDNLVQAAHSNLKLKQYRAARAQLQEIVELGSTLAVSTLEFQQQLLTPDIALAGLARRATLDGIKSSWIFEEKDELSDIAPPPLQGVQADKRSVCPLVLTPPEMLDDALELAQVTADDLLVDLGCGDGRMLSRAAKMTGCRAVGYDVNPYCLEQSRLAAARAGVTARVQVVNQDLFAVADDEHFRQATVVYVYLQPRVVERLEGLLVDAVEAGKRVLIYCQTGGSKSAPGNALRRLAPSKVSMGGMLRLYMRPG